ncbi:hypothetical protein [Bdellovibrio bacteriovorus]|uniref:hypothetical protein n=1 Tax=Bdellovibrio TaxID=958 RepID=UPI0035A8529D
MILKKQKIADLQLYVLTTVILAMASPGYAQNEEGFRNKSQAEHRAAFEACREELDLPQPEPGQRPQALDEETRDKLDACLKEKGFEPPKFGRGGHGKRPPVHEGSSGVQ